MIRLACLLLLVMTGVAAAQTIAVRSGEHGEFTRLVLRLPARMDWDLEQTGKTALLRLSGSDTRFDTSAVFGRIGRERLREIGQVEPGAPLKLALACSCKVRTTIERDRYLVLDITDAALGEDTLATRFSLPLGDPASFALGVEAASRTRDRSFEMADALSLPVASQPARPELGSPVAPKSARKSSSPADELIVAVPTDGQAKRMSISEDLLVRELARAASHGLLKPSSDLRDRTASGVDPMPPLDERAIGLRTRDDSELSLSAVSAVDLADLGRASAPERGVMRQPCASDTHLDLAAWSDGRLFHLQVGEARSVLFGEFDRVDPVAAAKLARIYLHFGFGAEARQALLLSAEDHPLLIELANILDGEIPSGDVFEGMAHCENSAALWAILAEPSTAASEVNKQAVLRAFWALPAHLRAHLGSGLSQTFAGLGDHDSAKLVLDSMTRADADQPAEYALAEIVLADLDDNPDRARQILAESSEANTAIAVEAMIQRVERAFAAREALAPDTPGLIASYLTEFRAGPSGPALRQAYSKSHALLGGFSDAFDSMEMVRSTDGSQAARDLEEVLLWLLLERGSDMDVLTRVLTLAPSDRIPADIRLQTAIAERLIAVGLPEPAEQFLSAAATDDDEGRRALLRAQVALLKNSPRDALLELLGARGNQAMILRAEAHRMLRDHDTAATYFQGLADTEAAARELWLTGDWERLSELAGTSDYAETARGLAAVSDLPLASQALGPLDHGRSLLSQSQTTRAEVGRVLDLTEGPIDAGS